jgi:plastocyanin
VEIVAAGSATDAKLRIAIAAVDDRFDPPCVALDEPGPVSIVVRNDGRHPHNFTLPKGPRASVDAGQVAILETVVDAGGVRYTCTIHPGMDGQLRVGN